MGAGQTPQTRPQTDMRHVCPPPQADRASANRLNETLLNQQTHVVAAVAVNVKREAGTAARVINEWRREIGRDCANEL